MNPATSAAPIALIVERWSAWAPGLETESDWRAWLDAPHALRGDEPASPPLPEVPAMARRRIEPLGRAALQVAYQCQEGLDAAAVAAMPQVFASRWGELARSMAMLQELAREQALSPTAFSHSVHNAIGALYSIQRGVTAPITAVAAACASLEAAWMEALGLLADGASQVLLVAFDAPLPAPYAQSGLDAPLNRLHAFALRLRRAQAGEIGIRLRTRSGERSAADSAEPPLLPPSLATLRWLIGAAARHEQVDPPLSWHWSREHVG